MSIPDFESIEYIEMDTTGWDGVFVNEYIEEFTTFANVQNPAQAILKIAAVWDRLNSFDNGTTKIVSRQDFINREESMRQENENYVKSRISTLKNKFKISNDEDILEEISEMWTDDNHINILLYQLRDYIQLPGFWDHRQVIQLIDELVCYEKVFSVTDWAVSGKVAAVTAFSKETEENGIGYINIYESISEFPILLLDNKAIHSDVLAEYLELLSAGLPSFDCVFSDKSVQTDWNWQGVELVLDESSGSINRTTSVNSSGSSWE